MLGPDGEITEWLGTSRDITERKQTEVALREGEAQMRNLLAELQHRVRNVLTVVRSVFPHGSRQQLDRPNSSITSEAGSTALPARRWWLRRTAAAASISKA